MAFTVLSTVGATQHSFSRGICILNGKGHIKRAEPRDDHDENIEIPLEEDEKESSVDVEVPSMSLEELLLPSPKCDVNQVGPTALAYIGDVVFELMVRTRHIWPTRRTSDLQRQVVALVRGTL